MFPDRFSDPEAESILLGQKKLILDIEQALEPDKPGLQDRINELQKQLISRLRPPVMQGKNNDLDAIRNTYSDSLAAMQLEGINVDENTTTVRFLKLIDAWNNKHKPKHATQSV